MNNLESMNNDRYMKYETRTLVFFSDFAANMGLTCLLKNTFRPDYLFFNLNHFTDSIGHNENIDENLSSIKTQQYSMPVYEFINNLLKQNRNHPENKIIIFTESHDKIILKLLASFKMFYLLSKKESPKFIYHTVTESINAASQHASPDIIDKIGGRWENEYLTHQQWLVLSQLAKTLSPAIIGEIWGLHVKTVSTHKRNIIRKLGFTSLQFLQLLMILGQVKEITTMEIRTPIYQNVMLGSRFSGELSAVGT